jgi:hypothetical protein
LFGRRCLRGRGSVDEAWRDSEVLVRIGVVSSLAAGDGLGRRKSGRIFDAALTGWVGGLFFSPPLDEPARGERYHAAGWRRESESSCTSEDSWVVARMRDPWPGVPPGALCGASIGSIKADGCSQHPDVASSRVPQVPSSRASDSQGPWKSLFENFSENIGLSLPMGPAGSHGASQGVDGGLVDSRPSLGREVEGENRQTFEVGSQTVLRNGATNNN